MWFRENYNKILTKAEVFALGIIPACDVTIRMTVNTCGVTAEFCYWITVYDATGHSSHHVTHNARLWRHNECNFLLRVRGSINCLGIDYDVIIKSYKCDVTNILFLKPMCWILLWSGDDCIHTFTIYRQLLGEGVWTPPADHCQIHIKWTSRAYDYHTSHITNARYTYPIYFEIRNCPFNSWSQ